MTFEAMIMKLNKAYNALKRQGQEFMEKSKVEQLAMQIKNPSRDIQVTMAIVTMREAHKADYMATMQYKFKPSLELSLAPYIQMYQTSTVLFFVAQLTIWAILVGSWWPAALGLYRLSWCRCKPTKYTSPNGRSWAMLPLCGFARFFNFAICGTLSRWSKNVPNQNVWEKG